ncbi:hypothetical protein M408DRAFT_137744 [Serendipita vermifera MAFF 305830]|uniref:Alginate lyase domain-containing protein n=1 Tax=Serendipita vermifera MAFF 305830 TaxID=933852 RepID=A0A0C3B998_SERVB|nr:hypothetical protein M408DRAFT_137744 [Serendipita vermifera MAFF 305830]
MFHLVFAFIFLVHFLPQAFGDGVDWIDPAYVKSYSSHHNSDTANAARGIIGRAHSLAKKGPFTVTKGNIKAPSGNERDYLSWAPYHWPDCNWCRSRGSPNGPKQNDYDRDNGNNDTASAGLGASDDPLDDAFLPDLTQQLLEYSIETIAPTEIPHLALRDEALSIPARSPSPMSITSSIEHMSLPSSDELQIATTDEAMEADRRPSPTTRSTCTTSPTSSMAPSSTWTKCPYTAKDGKVNPDRNQLHALSQLNGFAQATIDNALASILDNDPDAAATAAKFIDIFFLNSQTGMLPSIQWGQTLRGPSQRGSYMGVLDFRVLVKVVNAIQVLRAANSPVWTNDRDSKMVKWAKSYITWLETSELGARPKRSANNHSSFYYAQLAALKILVGDERGAINAVQAYFSGPFREQIVSSGEQPFESTRTKPFHYRAFNLQAMMTVAKLADYLGVNMWTAQTKYRSTIKTAVDYLIKVDPEQESQSDALPLVAAALAVYGDDSKATYRHFLESGGNVQQKKKSTSSYPYKTKTWWFYQQPEAFKHTPVASHRRSLPRDVVEDELYNYAGTNQEVLGNMPLMVSAFNTVAVAEASKTSSPLAMVLEPSSTLPNATQTGASDVAGPSDVCTTNTDQGGECDRTAGQAMSDGVQPEADMPGDMPILHPERPAPFAYTDAVELDEGIYVYWWQIRHLYEQSSEMKRSAWARW